MTLGEELAEILLCPEDGLTASLFLPRALLSRSPFFSSLFYLFPPEKRYSLPVRSLEAGRCYFRALERSEGFAATCCQAQKPHSLERSEGFAATCRQPQKPHSLECFDFSSRHSDEISLQLLQLKDYLCEDIAAEAKRFCATKIMPSSLEDYLLAARLLLEKGDNFRFRAAAKRGLAAYAREFGAPENLSLWGEIESQVADAPLLPRVIAESPRLTYFLDPTGGQVIKSPVPPISAHNSRTFFVGDDGRKAVAPWPLPSTLEDRLDDVSWAELEVDYEREECRVSAGPFDPRGSCEPRFFPGRGGEYFVLAGGRARRFAWGAGELASAELDCEREISAHFLGPGEDEVSFLGPDSLTWNYASGEKKGLELRNYSGSALNLEREILEAAYLPSGTLVLVLPDRALYLRQEPSHSAEPATRWKEVATLNLSGESTCDQRLIYQEEGGTLEISDLRTGQPLFQGRGYFRRKRRSHLHLSFSPPAMEGDWSWLGKERKDCLLVVLLDRETGREVLEMRVPA